MTRFVIVGFATLVLVESALTCAAQDGAVQPNDGMREFTVSGCLLRSGYAAYQLDEVKLVAIDGKPVPADAGQTDAPPKKWALQGGGNLGPRVGEKVQVVGRSDWQASAAAKDPIDGPAENGPTLNVKTLKSIAPGCA